MKTVFKLFLLLALIVYLGFAFTKFSRKGNETICKQVNYTITDSAHAGFITISEAERLLKSSDLYPIGKQLEEINGQAIEEMYLKNNFIDSVLCYTSPNGAVNILIMQRLPLMRIMASNGDDYYIDEQGHIMNPQGYAANLVVATGAITRPFARESLTQMGKFLQENSFWDDQIEQIEVTPKQKIDLVTRVGGHIIHFGTTDDIELKFQNLELFYEKVLSQVGWNKYSEISVENVSQIVGTKKGKSK